MTQSPCPANTYSPTGRGDVSECAQFVLRVYNIGAGVSSFPNTSNLSPTGIAYVNNINVPDGIGNEFWLPLVPSTPNDFFAATFTGAFKIYTAGNYTFCSSSDDGSTVTIDGALVVDIDSPHPLQRACGATRHLATGSHSIYVTYFNDGGYAGVTVSYKGPDTGGVEVIVGHPTTVNRPAILFFTLNLQNISWSSVAKYVSARLHILPTI